MILNQVSLLSKRINLIKPSATLAITAKANELKAQGIDIIPMASGEPDFDTPKHIAQAGIVAINNGQTRYTAVDGTKGLKTAIINKFKKDNNLTYQAEQIIVSSGGKQVFYNLCQAILDKGDEVIIPAPYWVSYPDMVLLSNANPIIVDTTLASGFKLTAKQLESTITPQTKLLVINSPSNPTGAVYSQAELQALANVLEKYPNIYILSDDIYEHIRFNKKQDFYNIAMFSDKLKERTIILNGVSKAYAMTGWRIGYGAGQTSIIKAMKKVQSQSTSNPCSIAQAAAEVALTGNQDFTTMMTEEFNSRYQYISAELGKIDGIVCPETKGAFYLFPDVSGLIKRLGLKDDLALGAYCLEKLNIAVVPGSAFGKSNCIRFSFATSMDNIKECVRRLRDL